MIRSSFLVVFSFAAGLSVAFGENRSERLIEPLRPFASQVDAAIRKLPESRRALLDRAVGFIGKELGEGGEVDLTFICTHNSRRSHLSQIWAQVGAHYYAVGTVRTFSGGTESTACNIRTVRALRRAGLSVVATTQGGNPRYLVQYSESEPPIEAYSKVYNVDGNPRKGFAAVMCCADADERCPDVDGAEFRLALDYVDPKVSDGTPAEAATYDERSVQIATEMFYIMSQVAAKRAK